MEDLFPWRPPTERWAGAAGIGAPVVQLVGFPDRVHYAALGGAVSQAPKVPQLMGNEVVDADGNRRIPSGPGLDPGPNPDPRCLGRLGSARARVRVQPCQTHHCHAASPVAEAHKGSAFPSRQGMSCDSDDGWALAEFETLRRDLLEDAQKGVDHHPTIRADDTVGKRKSPRSRRKPEAAWIRRFPEENDGRRLASESSSSPGVTSSPGPDSHGPPPSGPACVSSAPTRHKRAFG